MGIRTNTLLTAGLMAFGIGACGPAGDEQGTYDCSNLPEGKILQECIDKGTPKAERMDSENDPMNFGVEMDTLVSGLPTTGRAQKLAWPDDYWATVRDSVNHRWQGQDTLSPLEKYDVAFNDWTPPAGFMSLKPFSECGERFDAEYYSKLGPAAKYWSNNHGNKAMRDKWNKSDCSEAIETWWGLCHAWVPAAILEEEPEHAVTYKGVTFEASDIKALLMMQYNNTSTRFLGRRCNLRNDEITRDEQGRIEQIECRDTNAGSLHLVLTNLLGRDKRAFAEDRTTNYEVWNQPVIGYRIKVVEEINEQQATKLLDPDCGSNCKYRWNSDAKRFFETLTEVDYVSESSPSTEPRIPEIDNYTQTDTYHYVLECDTAGNIIGGEWISAQVTAFPNRIHYPPDSQESHVDFLWLPLRAGYTTNPSASLENVRMLLRMSRSDNPPPDGDVKVFKNETAVEIPDNNTAGASSAIEVNEDVTFSGLKATVNITHAYSGDLTLKLKHGSKTVTLQQNAGGGSANIKKTFTVEGFTGSARGTWELLAVDNAEQDSGTIVSWQLAFATGAGPTPTTETFSNNERKDIPDKNSRGITSVISVPGSGAVKSLKVKVDISHGWVSDLRVTLKHGTGTVTLHNREGNNSADIKKTYTVEDFNGFDSSGDWKLKVVDAAKDTVGALNSWSIEIER